MIIRKFVLLIRLIRMKHWIKNFLVFLSLFFSGNIFTIDLLLKNLVAFFSFCMIASSIYIINDIKDVEQDRRHTTKCKRPLASGEISITAALIIMCAMVSIGSLLLFVSQPVKFVMAIVLIFTYLVINIFYSCCGKNIPLLDVIILASGFVIRVYYGTCVTGINVSEWLFMVILSGSLFMGLGKRRNELKNSNDDTRKVIKYYNYSFLTYNMYSCMTIMIIFYSLWCANYKESKMMLYTIPLCIIIMMRYSYVIECNDSEGDPIEVLMKDKALIGLTILFILLMCVCVYIA